MGRICFACVFVLSRHFLSVFSRNSDFQRRYNLQGRYISLTPSPLWLAKWCKIHKVYIYSHSMLLLLFTNVFIHIQQPSLRSWNIFIHIWQCNSFSRLYILTFRRCRHSHSTRYICSHSRSKYGWRNGAKFTKSIFIQHFLRTTLSHH